MRVQWHNGGLRGKGDALTNPQSAIRNPQFRAAFTLIELMVVILIISVLSGVIVAEMHGTIQDAVLRATSRDLAAAFSAVSSRSVAVNRPLRLQLDSVKHRYFTERSTRGGSDFFPVRDVPGGEGRLDPRITVKVLPPGTPLPDQSDEEPAADAGNQDELLPPERASSVTFFPDGTAEARAIELTDRDGYQMGLRINPVTARVQILAMGRK